MWSGFEARVLAGAGAAISVKIGGSGPPLLLLHGYPVTSAMWAGLAPALAERRSLIIPDLRGYGASEAPANDAENHAYSKRRMGEDMFAVMDALGHGQFDICGHDRGARVAYRMAFDRPERIGRIAVLDIVPVSEVWERMDARAALKTYHWPFLAQPSPIPETLIGADPVFFLDRIMASWTKTKSLEAFDARALEEYRLSFRRPERIRASCDDYRAGATVDWALDAADRTKGRKISARTLALWGSAGIPAGGTDVLGIWQDWCEDAVGFEVDAGHFVVEEAPEETLAALDDFFR